MHAAHVTFTEADAATHGAHQHTHGQPLHLAFGEMAHGFGLGVRDVLEDRGKESEQVEHEHKDHGQDKLRYSGNRVPEL